MEFVTDTEIEQYLNMEGLASKFSASAQSAGAMATVRANADAVIKAHLSAKHMAMQSEVCGYWLTRKAEGGETEFSLPAAMWAPQECYVWVNYCGAWRDRDPNKTVPVTITPVGAPTVTDYKVVLSEQLQAGDTAIMDVYHSGINAPVLLKKLALDVAVYDLITRKQSLCNDPIARDNYQRMDQLAREMLSNLLKGRIRIDEWDQLSRRIIPENQTVSPEGHGTFIVGW